MIRVRLEYSTDVFTQIENDIESFEIIAFALLRQSMDKVKRPLLSDLRKTPKRRYWEGKDFANDASRRAFFAKTGGKAYERTGKYAAGWDLNIRKTDSGGELVVANKEPYAKYVGGSFARSGRDFQQKGHVRTGHARSTDSNDKWAETVLDDFVQRVTNHFGGSAIADINRGGE